MNVRDLSNDVASYFIGLIKKTYKAMRCICPPLNPVVELLIPLASLMPWWSTVRPNAVVVTSSREEYSSITGLLRYVSYFWGSCSMKVLAPPNSAAFWTLEKSEEWVGSPNEMLSRIYKKNLAGKIEQIGKERTHLKEKGYSPGTIQLLRFLNLKIAMFWYPGHWIVFRLPRDHIA